MTNAADLRARARHVRQITQAISGRNTADLACLAAELEVLADAMDERRAHHQETYDETSPWEFLDPERAPGSA